MRVGPQGVFRLKHAMGGGKTHNMVAAGLLAKHPHLRRGVLGKLGIAVDNRDIAVAAFTGREGSVQEFLWLDIARQLCSDSSRPPWRAVGPESRVLHPSVL